MEAALSHFRAGRLDEAIEALGAEVRNQPLDTRLRTFLFELLCFAGDLDRAEKQLTVLGGQNAKAEAGAVLLKGLLQAHREREETFAASPPTADEDAYRGRVTVNEKNFASCTDEDPRMGACLEVYQGDHYRRVPFRAVQQLTIAAPSSLRDLLWIPATLTLHQATESGDAETRVHLPALAPQTSRHSNQAVRLGRLSVVEEDERGSPVPFGTKLLLFGDEEISLLDIRSLAFPAVEE